VRWAPGCCRRRSYSIDGEVVEGIFACDLTLAEVASLRAKQRWPFRDQSHNGMYQVATLEQFLDIALVRCPPARQLVVCVQPTCSFRAAPAQLW
jgi:hypothetical protein